MVVTIMFTAVDTTWKRHVFCDERNVDNVVVYQEEPEHEKDGFTFLFDGFSTHSEGSFVS